MPESESVRTMGSGIRLFRSSLHYMRSTSICFALWIVEAQVACILRRPSVSASRSLSNSPSAHLNDDWKRSHHLIDHVRRADRICRGGDLHQSAPAVQVKDCCTCLKYARVTVYVSVCFCGKLYSVETEGVKEGTVPELSTGSGELVAGWDAFCCGACNHGTGTEGREWHRRDTISGSESNFSPFLIF